MQSSQRAKEQCGANFCMMLAASRLTTTCTPITACMGMVQGLHCHNPAWSPSVPGEPPAAKGLWGNPGMRTALGMHQSL